jgi:hypothetical protein
MQGYGRNDAASSAAQSGIPVAFSPAKQIPKTSRRIRLPGGVEVEEQRYEDFATELQRFGTAIATQPSQVPRHVANLGNRLMQLHAQELADQASSLARHYDSPHTARWEAHRSRLRAQTLATRGIDVAKNRALIEHVFGADKSGLEGFRQMAEDTGAGDHPAVHVFLAKVGAMLERKKGLYGGGPVGNVGSPTLGKQKPAYAPPTSAAPKSSKAEVSAYSGRPSPASARPVKAGSASKRLYGNG